MTNEEVAEVKSGFVSAQKKLKLVIEAETLSELTTKVRITFMELVKRPFAPVLSYARFVTDSDEDTEF